MQKNSELILEEQSVGGIWALTAYARYNAKLPTKTLSSTGNNTNKAFYPNA